jgi:hypothetical protein
MRALVLAAAACTSSHAPPIANAGGAPPKPPTWCDDVLANRLDRAGLPLRPLLEAQPFDKEAVFVFLRAQPCVAGKVVIDDSVGPLSGTAAIVEIPRAGGANLRCKWNLDRDESGRATFTMSCKPR